MRIWVDDDACPAPIREILFRAAQREAVPLTLVANRPVRAPPSPLIRSVQVAGGFDAADREITRSVAPGDLVITADIPLAADVVAAGAVALNPRGELYTEANVRERLAMRDISEELRAIGKGGGGPPKLGPRERQSFAKQLDRLLAAARRSRFP